MNSCAPPATPFCLVVEDCDEDYRTLERFVNRSQQPMELRRCAQAEEVMAMLDGTRALSQCPATVPAVIILDLSLAGRDDGRAVLQAVRKHPALKRTPVVVFSSSTDPADIDWCQRHGANAYQVKNMDFMSFQCVAELLVTYMRGVAPRPTVR